ncbi:MAG: TerB family tellurite resistance protein [Candidatus Binatia bacterium]
MESHASRCLARLAVALITADGRVTPAEDAALTRLDTLGFGTVSHLARREIRNPTAAPPDLRVACAWLAESDPRTTAAIVRALAELAACDGRVSLAEIAVLNDVARLLGLRVRDARHLLNAAITTRAATGAGLAAERR